jgi:hypothetical protein
MVIVEASEPSQGSGGNPRPFTLSSDEHPMLAAILAPEGPWVVRVRKPGQRTLVQTI